MLIDNTSVPKRLNFRRELSGETKNKINVFRSMSLINPPGANLVFHTFSHYSLQYRLVMRERERASERERIYFSAHRNYLAVYARDENSFTRQVLVKWLFFLCLIIIIKACWQRGFTWLSFAIDPSRSFIMLILLDAIQCPHKADG